MAVNIIRCPVCGGTEFEEEKNYRTCLYCGTRHQIPKEERPARQSEIALNSDVERLLAKCRSDPRNARKYANLILDIDPTNTEALKYL